MQKVPVGASNRFVAQGIAGHAKIRLAARAVAACAGDADVDVAVAFTSSLAFRDPKARLLELVVGPGIERLNAEPELRTGKDTLVHIPTRVTIRLHKAGEPIPGGPVCWPDPSRHVEMFEGVPVLSINSFLDTEITRALNLPGHGYDENVVNAILASGISRDRVLELHPYVTEAFHDLWERAQQKRQWPAVA